MSANTLEKLDALEIRDDLTNALNPCWSSNLLDLRLATKIESERSVRQTFGVGTQ